MSLLENHQSQTHLIASSLTSSSPLSSVTELNRNSSSLKNCEKWHDMERISVQDLKVRITRRLGSRRADKYFSHFREFIGSRLNKHEFDKLAVIEIGRENVHLHNQLVRAILINSVNANAALLPSGCIDVAAPDSLFSCLSKGDLNHSLPLCNRSHDHNRDHYNTVSHHGGDDNQLDHGDSYYSSQYPAKRPCILKPSSDECTSVVESDGLDNNCLNDDRMDVYNSLQYERMDMSPPLTFGSILSAPLGIPLQIKALDIDLPRSASTAIFFHEGDLASHYFLDVEDLPNNATLHRRMEYIAAAKGLGSVSRESADVLNHALDAYLSRLIRSCVKTLEHNVLTDRFPPRAVRHNLNQHRYERKISMLDFKVAMDSNPNLIGDLHPVKLEKILFHLFDE